MKKQKLIAVFSLVLATAGFSSATQTGLDSSPLGDRSSAGIGYALWDSFSAITFSDLAPTAGDIPLTLAQSATGSGAGFGPYMTDYFYTSTKATDWTISGTASTIDINTVVLQIKLSTPAAGTLTEFFSPTLNGTGATPVVTATGIEPGGLAGAGYNILTWTWTDLDIASGQTFAINFSNPANGYHVAIDGFAVDVAPVPEPSTYGIAAALLLAVVIWRRRCVSRSAS